jgi:hypothetical protein
MIGGFQMPHHDVAITITRIGGSPAQTLEDAKASALASLEAAYGSYNRNLYSDANWLALTAAYESGRSEIDAAATVDGVNSARRAALAAMAAVRTIADESGSGSGGASGTPLPDFGAAVGKVRVIIENQTFKGPASDGSLPAWYGTW